MRGLGKVMVRWIGGWLRQATYVTRSKLSEEWTDSVQLCERNLPPVRELNLLLVKHVTLRLDQDQGGGEVGEGAGVGLVGVVGLVGHGAMHTLLRPGPPALLSWMLCFLPATTSLK